MSKVGQTCMMCLLALVLVPTMASAEDIITVYDAADNFSITNGNPNGAWTYGGIGWWLAFHAYDTPGTRSFGGSGLDIWYQAARGVDPGVYYNATASSLTDFGATLAPGDLALDAYLGDDTSWGWPTVRWTAPEACVIDIAATWIN